MSKALLKKSMQILDESEPKHIFVKEKLEEGKVKKGEWFVY